MVTRLRQNGNIVINKGINARVRPQTTYYVTRMKKPIAIIKVVQVDDYNSTCQVVELMPGQRIEIGDVFSDSEFEKPEEEKPDRGKDRGKTKKKKTEEEIEKEKIKNRKEYEKKVIENFKKVVSRKTRVIGFKRGSGGTVKISLFDTYNLLSTIVFAGQYASFNPWYAGTYAWGIYSSYKSSSNPKRIRNVMMEITYWDVDYLDAYASYYAYKEVVKDLKRVKMVRDNIYRQKGLDKFHVFQVKIMNPGPGAFQLAPFPWHFYLEGRGGKRLKADHYDEILDKALNPHQAVNGYLYFKRNDQHGQPVLDGKDVTVILEDILGNRRKIKF